MPNTLVHLCVQAPATRLVLREADFKLIALGCIIPDIPWIMQRIILSTLPEIDRLNLLTYAVIQASLVFCLLLTMALSLFSSRPRRMFLLLSANAFLHLLIDALQVKWANGVHFFAPFSWEMKSFSLFWPEHLLTYVLSVLGLLVLVFLGVRDWHKTVCLTSKKKNRIAATVLISAYFFCPFLLLEGPVRENSHFIGTLRQVDERPGKYIEFDRGLFRSSDNSFLTFLGERMHLRGNLPHEDGRLSLQGSFVDMNTIEVSRSHIHDFPRDLASKIALAGVLIIWLAALGSKKFVLESPTRNA